MENKELQKEYLINTNQWVVGINRPYYPSIEFFVDEIEAQNYYKELTLEEHEEDGKYMVKTFISKVLDLEEILTHF